MKDAEYSHYPVCEPVIDYLVTPGMTLISGFQLVAPPANMRLRGYGAELSVEMRKNAPSGNYAITRK